MATRIEGSDVAVGVDSDRESVAGELVDHGEHLHGVATGGGVELKVHGPEGVRTNW